MFFTSLAGLKIIECGWDVGLLINVVGKECVGLPAIQESKGMQVKN